MSLKSTQSPQPCLGQERPEKYKSKYKYQNKCTKYETTTRPAAGRPCPGQERQVWPRAPHRGSSPCFKVKKLKEAPNKKKMP